MCIPFVVYTARLVDWQLINDDDYRKRAESSNSYSIKTDAIRGEIVGSEGEGIVINSTGYRVVVDRLQTGKERENYVIAKAVELLDKLKVNWIDVLPIGIKDNQYIFLENRGSQISSLKKFLGAEISSTAQECMDILASKYGCKEYTVKDKRSICSVKYNTGRAGGYNSRAIPYILADNVSKEVMLVTSEYSSRLIGLRVETSLVRKYPDGTLAPHIIGYIGPMSAEEYEKRKDTYSMDEFIGKSGIEGIMEDYLRGKSGRKVLQRARDGTITGSLEKQAAVAGNTVQLTLNSTVQKAANESLKRNIEKAQKMGVSDCRSGAAVVLRVKDFSVLAASTYPSFDLTRFAEDKSYYSELVSDKLNTPLINRAFSGAFAPGSIYKPLVACAALESGVVGPKDTVNCNGKYSYYRGYTLGCMGVHGNINISRAIEKSCNVFFAEMGRRVGASLLAEYARKFGMGVKTGLEVYESSGVLAGPEHSKAVGSHWYESGSSQAAIGQSDNMITPVQLAAYVATIANDGNRYKTHLVKRVTNYSKSQTIMEGLPEIIETSGVSYENMNIVKSAMRQVAVSGTAADFRNYPVAIAAKTGTAENSGSDHVTFICFAPYENPEIALSVVVANGKYSVISKNVARDILNAYFNIIEHKE